MAAQALAFPPWLRHGRGAQLASLRRASFIKMALRGDTEGDPAQRGGSASEQPFDSDRKAKSQRRHAQSAIGGQCKCTDPCRARGLAKRGESQGGRRGHAAGRVTRHVFLHFFFILLFSSYLILACLVAGVVEFDFAAEDAVDVVAVGEDEGDADGNDGEEDF
jgi:hypothetical protein